MNMHNPLHPGEIIREILITGANMTVTEAAQRLSVSRTTLSRLINGNIGISSDMALRLSKLLPNTDIIFWMNIQRDYDVWLVKKKEGKIRIKPLKSAA